MKPVLINKIVCMPIYKKIQYPCNILYKRKNCRKRITAKPIKGKYQIKNMIETNQYSQSD